MTLYYRPDTLSAALKLLNDPQRKALPLYYSPRAKNLKDWQAGALVELTELGLDEIRATKKELHLGSMISLEVLAENEIVRSLWDGVLCKAVSYSATKAMRNLATLGGVLVESANPPEILLVLMVLGAEVVLVDASKRLRKCSVEEFIASAERLPHGSLIKELVIPIRPRTRCVLERIARTEKDTAIVALAACGEMTQRKAAGLRVAVSGVKDLPYRLTAAEAVFEEDISFTLKNIEKAAEAVTSESVAAEDFRGSAEYRQAMVPVLTKRALTELRALANA